VQVGMTGRQGLDMAMRAMVSRAVGAGDIARANHVALQAFTLSGAFSVLMALIGVFFTEPLLAVLGVPDNVIAAGADYMRIQFVGSGTNAFRMMSGAALQSAGDTLTPMRSATVSRFLHVVLSPMFVFGWLCSQRSV
jgi:Na+-driven multidrug efflux pump